MKPAAFDYVRPHSTAELYAAIADDASGAKILAGGQSLGPMLNLRLARPSRLVDIRHVTELRTVKADSRTASLGATLTHAEIEDGGVEDFTCGLLPFVAHGIAYRAVRNRGTLGGSLAHADPAADWVTTMAGLGAHIVVGSGAGERRVAADQFMLGAFSAQVGATEVITAVEMPRLSASARWGYVKICRKVGEFAKAIALAIHDPARNLARIVIGATEGPPVLLPAASDALAEHGPDRAVQVAGEEIETVLARLDQSHRGQLKVVVGRSLQKQALREAA